MRPSGAALLPLVIVGALAGLTFWLDKATSGQEQTARANKRHDPDFFVEKFNVQRYDATGQLINSLVADKMTHFPDDDTTDVINPDLTIHRNGRPMRITAKTAHMTKDGKEVLMKGNVRLLRPAGERPALLLETESMTALSDEQRARSNAPIRITQGSTVLHGGGVDYDGKALVTQLTGGVRGTFVQGNK